MAPPFRPAALALIFCSDAQNRDVAHGDEP